MEVSDERYARVTQSYERAIAGHVYIRETMDALFDAVHGRVRGLGRAPAILELGSHTGFVTELLLQRWPEAQIVVHEQKAELVAIAKRRLAGRTVRFHTTPLADLTWQPDLVISVARHHHLPHDYLGSVRRIMTADSVYLLADELCPEYCRGPYVERIEQAELLHILGGYVLTTAAEVRAYEQRGVLPEPAVELERSRQRALWRWYRFVVDHAVEHGYFDVAVVELQSTHDDLITGSPAEHKFSPLIVEREFALAGFRRLSKRMIGPADDPERQSMFVYEYALQ